MSLEVALQLSKLGLAVLPVRGKRPLTPHGVHSASSDPKIFRRWNWKGADCAVATGRVIDVLDVDVRWPRSLRGQEEKLGSNGEGGGRNGFQTIEVLGLSLPETVSASTPSGGRHYWFRHVKGSRSRTIGEGLEWWAKGKFAIVPPAEGREWVNAGAVAEAPEELKRLVLTRISPGDDTSPIFSSGPPMTAAADTNTGASRVPQPVYIMILRLMPLTRCSRRDQRRAAALFNVVAKKQEGRNNALNYAAWRFRELVEKEAISGIGACKLLLMASKANGYLAKDGAEAVRATIMSGFGLGEWPQ